MRAHIISSSTGSFAVLLPAPLLLRALRLVGDLCPAEPPPWSCDDKYGSMGSCKLTPAGSQKLWGAVGQEAKGKLLDVTCLVKTIRIKRFTLFFVFGSVPDLAVGKHATAVV